jgi:hypothetical protein
MTKSIPPSVNETAFSCPYCGAFTTQHWFKVYGSQLPKDSKTPVIPDEGTKRMYLKEEDLEEAVKKALAVWADKMISGLVFIEKTSSSYLNDLINNLFLSQCYNCEKIAVWAHDRLIFPPERVGPLPNSDLPEGVVCDFEEARSIVNLSPRGAAALLRLCVQKLCFSLGEKGKSIDDDVASLVSKGLNPLVQKSLDIVRVIGNEAVHPGLIDLKDDRDTALRLFDLVNTIADQMISHPKHVNEMYQMLPEGKRQAIETRNEKAKKNQE